MNERNFDEELDALLEELINSELSPDELRELASHAQPELIALLETAAALRAELRPQAPDPGFARNVEIRILNRVRAAHKGSQAGASPAPKAGWLPVPRLARAALTVLLVLGVFLTAAVGTVAAAANSLPGEDLYPIKRGIERARLALTFSPEGDLELLGHFSDERLDEIEALLGSGRYQDLSLAIEEYSAALAQYEQAGTDSETATVDPAVDEKLMQHILILQTVKDQVPAQAQPAIQQVIDNQLQHAGDEPPGKQDPGQPSDTGPEEGESGQGPEKRNEILAEEIAGQYEVEVEAVQAIYDGQCEGDWTCVREYFREQYGPPGKPSDVPEPGGGNPE